MFSSFAAAVAPLATIGKSLLFSTLSRVGTALLSSTADALGKKVSSFFGSSEAKPVRVINEWVDRTRQRLDDRLQNYVQAKIPRPRPQQPAAIMAPDNDEPAVRKRRKNVPLSDIELQDPAAMDPDEF